MARFVLCLGLLLIPAAVVPTIGCGNGDGDAVVTRSYKGTQAPGDLWTWALLSTSLFTASNDTLGLTYEGTWAPLPSGFLQLTITATSDPGATVGDTAYALEIPDSLLVIKPAGTDENLIIAANVGTCPTGPALAVNWVEVTDSGWMAGTDVAYGHSAVTIGATWNVVNTRYLLDGTPDGMETLTGLTCASGLITNPAVPGEVIVMSPTGVFITDNGPGGGGVMGMNVPAAPVDLLDLVAAGREYRSFQYKDDSVGSDDSRPNWARPDGAGHLTGGDYMDVVSNVEMTTSLATIDFQGQVSPGVVDGELTDGAGTSDIVFVINRIAGRYVILGIAVDTADMLPYNFVAIELP